MSAEVAKLKNILVFLCVLFGECSGFIETLMGLSPDYILDKYKQYCEGDEASFLWGMHTNLLEFRFNAYLKQWGIECK